MEIDRHDRERNPTWRLRVFYDGDCPLCVREIRWLKTRTPSGNVAFDDIALPGYDFATLGLTRETLMGRIHAQLPDGRFVTGMDVFRALYREAGLGWLMAPTRWPGIRWLADRVYDWFAGNRLWLTGREDCQDQCAIAGPDREREGAS